MKVLVKDCEEEGLMALIGKNVTLFCGVYIYTGKLVGVNSTCVKLESASIVYDTGSLSSPTWAMAEKLPNDWYVSLNAVESFGVLK